jgi:adenosine kinase
VDTESVHVSEVRHTARFVCTTDEHANQIATFYAGAMQEARDIELGPIVDRVGTVDLVLIGANDPEAMMRHTEECRYRRIPFAADPSQQLARMHGDEIRLLVDGAAYLFTNEYEAALTEQKTGWSSEEILDRVGTRVTTLGPSGVRIERKGQDMIQVPTPKETHKADPTGVGDAFRAGFLSGLAWGLPLQRCAQVGSLLATHVIESIGTQEYELARRSFLLRIREAYGDQAAEEIGAHISLARP